MDFVHRVLIVDSQIFERRKLADAIRALGGTDAIEEAHSVQEARDMLLKKHYSVCFVGAGLTESVQRDLIRSVSSNNENTSALIPLCAEPSKEQVMRYVEAGAHGVLVIPIQAEALKRVIETAFHAAKGRASTSVLVSHEPTTLPDTLETVGRRLIATAQRLREEKVFRPSNSSSYALKRALLQTFALTELDDELFVTYFMDVLIGKDRDQEE